MLRLLAYSCLSVLLLAFAPAPGMAQDGVPANLAPMVEQARKDGMTVVILQPGTAPAAAAEAAAPMAMTDIGLQVRTEIARLLVSAPDIPRRMSAALEIASPDGSLAWLGMAVLIAVAGIVAGYLASRVTVRLARDLFRPLFRPEPEDDAQKIGFLAARSMIAAFNTLVLFAVAMVVAILFDTGHEPTRRTVAVIITGYSFWRFLHFVVSMNLFAPDLPRHRMLAISDADAIAFSRDFRWVSAVAVIVLSTSQWLVTLDLDGDANKLLLIAASFIAAGLIIYLTLRHRTAIAGAILGAGDPETKPIWLRALAASWHIIGLLYVVVATGASVIRLLLNLPSANVLISAPGIALLGAIGAYGALYLAIEWYYRARRIAFEKRVERQMVLAANRHAAEMSARAEARSAGADMQEEETVNATLPTPAMAASVVAHFKPLFKPLAQQAAGLVVTFFAIGFVMEAWSIRTVGGQSLVGAFMNTIAVIFVAWALYQAIVIFVNDRLAAETGSRASAEEEIEDEPRGQGSSRLGTLLPLVRNVLVTLVFAVAAMIVLANLGVDIAPLFAGAGVVGLAVGFGAQALIKDIFSGGFFLFDDAFRKGEYIELGSIRGTVEKISLRSFQLRHHNGPLHTIPFGEITQLTNYSRDWVIMKLPLRVTYDTDVEKVRKLIKKLGQQLLSHPEVGKHFLQPLKSQGVVEMDDSALVLRVKFMTKPGDQWQTRKVVYASIQDLFQREGIRFANREVTVRISGDGAASPEAIRQAASAAARNVIDQADAAAALGNASGAGS